MNKIEAIKEMLKGKIVGKKAWPRDKYIHMTEKGDFETESGGWANMSLYYFNGWIVAK